MTDRMKYVKKKKNAENITRRVRAIPQVLQLAMSRTNGQTRTVTIQYALTGAMALLIYSYSVHKVPSKFQCTKQIAFSAVLRVILTAS